MYRSKDVLKENGLLSDVIDGFTPRLAQQNMAEAIEQAIDFNATIIIEAGTGTGKSLGYLIPAFIADKKVIISTGTKNLQDQLFFKDIPLAQNVLKNTSKVVLLKGRSNYLCLHRMHRNRSEGRFTSRQLVSDLERIAEWSVQTETGDIAELSHLQEDSAIWPYVTSTVDNCLGPECEFYKECFVMKARQQALAANMIVVNHHLFFADMALQEEGFGELLPGADVIIFDEAHHLPEIASRFFSTDFTSRQLIELARDVEVETAKEAKDTAQLNDEALYLQRAVQEMRIALSPEMRSFPWPERQTTSLINAIDEIKVRLCRLEQLLKIVASRSKGLENCSKRSIQLIERFDLVTQPAPENMVHWVEMHLQNFTIHLTPMIVAEQFKNYMAEKKRAWIFTSATLTVKNNFSLFTETLGLKNELSLQLASPFDYQKQAILYSPRGLPDPHDISYTDAFIDAAIPVINAAQGKTFLLFTSFKALDRAASYLANKIEFPILRQGDKPKRKLIEEFKALGNAVLLGTSSFWYGVDVKGDALSCVMIDKLPFASPDDPILQSRIRMLKKKGVDSFATQQLPHAVLILKQGVGRLIRDVYDRGVLMIGDPRLVGNPYGDVFLQSLPNMRRTREFEKVRHFLQEGAE